MPLSGPEMTRRLREYKSPTFGYREGEDGEVEKDLFDGELPKGWVDSPAKVGKKAAKKPEKAAQGIATPDSDATASGNTEDTPNAKNYDDMGFHELRLELQQRTGKGPRPGTTKVQIIEMLEDLDNAVT